MSDRPIFLATHPRSCSTAFERLFLSRHDDVVCIHEPFTAGPYHWGPERLGERYEGNETYRAEWGLGDDTTYKMVIDKMRYHQGKGKRVFCKDMAYGIIPLHGKPSSIAPSLLLSEQGEVNANISASSNPDYSDLKSTNQNHTELLPPYPYVPQVVEPLNPTVLPEAVLREFHFTFLIRHPYLSVPSVYRLTLPPLSHATGWHYFNPEEISYGPVRRLFDYLIYTGQIGPTIAGTATDDDVQICNDNDHQSNHKVGSTDICVVEADELLDDPTGVLEVYCKSIGLPYNPSMLDWDTPANQQRAEDAFKMTRGFNGSALNSKSLMPRAARCKTPSLSELVAEWTQEFGTEAANVIKDTAEKNMDDYKHMKRFALNVQSKLRIQSQS